MNMTADQTVYVLDHRPVQGDPVFHVSADCPMVAYEEARRPGTYKETPRWVADLAGLRQCEMNGPCRNAGA